MALTREQSLESSEAAPTDANTPTSAYTPSDDSDSASGSGAFGDGADIEIMHFLDTEPPNDRAGSPTGLLQTQHARVTLQGSDTQAQLRDNMSSQQTEPAALRDSNPLELSNTQAHTQTMLLTESRCDRLPKPAKPPTSEDWQLHRAIFTRLYRTERKSLKQAKALMQTKYDFHATERMYKQRIADWSLRKNYNSRRTSDSSHSDSVEGLSDENLEDSSSSQRQQDSRRMMVNSSTAGIGKPSRHSTQAKQRSKAHSSVRKAHILYLESYLRSQEPNMSLTRFRGISQDLNNVETLLGLVDNYYEVYFDAAWKREYPNPPRFVMREMPVCVDVKRLLNSDEIPNVIHPTSLFCRFQLAVAMFDKKTVEANQVGARFLNEAYNILKDTLAQGHPQLLRCFLEQFYCTLYDTHPTLIPQLLQMSAEYAKMVYGERHPITKFCLLLPKLPNRLDVILVLWRRLHDTFAEKLGVSHEENIRSKMALCGVLIERGKYLEAEEILEFISANSDRAPTDYWTRAVRCRLGWLYVAQQRFTQAEEVLKDLLLRYKGYAGVEVVPIDAIYIASLSLLARSHSGRKEYDLAKGMLDDALDICLRIFGKEHGYSMSVRFEMDELTWSRADVFEVL